MSGDPEELKTAGGKVIHNPLQAPEPDEAGEAFPPVVTTDPEGITNG